MFDIKKFLSGFNIFDGEKLGKIVFYGILVAAGLAVYHQITKPTTNIIAKPGSNVTIVQQDSKKKLETFGEPFVQVNTKGEFVGGLRAGIRF